MTTSSPLAGEDGDPGARRRLDPASGRDYDRLLARAVAQLEGQRTGVSGPPRLLIVVPVVGFGAQSCAGLGRTVGLLEAGVGTVRGLDPLTVFVVNRPLTQPDDGTAVALREMVAGRPDALVCDLPLARRTRIGELRQVAIDAVETAFGPLPANAVIVPADDDLVRLPDATLSRLVRSLAHPGDGVHPEPVPLAIGPVLFDDPALPTCLFPELYAADLVRALVVDRLLSAFEHPHLGGRPAPAVYESIVLSCHLGVRRDALSAVGGFRDLNELTGLMRDAMDERIPRVGRPLPLWAGAPVCTEPVERLRASAVRVSSRRALAAWRAGRHPTVAQWRGARLMSSRIDPVRLAAPVAPPAPLAELSGTARRDALAGLGGALGVVFDHLRPPPAVAAWALRCLGAEPWDVHLVPAGEEHGWRVILRRIDSLLDRLVELQQADLAEQAR